MKISGRLLLNVYLWHIVVCIRVYAATHSVYWNSPISNWLHRLASRYNLYMLYLDQHSKDQKVNQIKTKIDGHFLL